MHLKLKNQMYLLVGLKIVRVKHYNHSLGIYLYSIMEIAEVHLIFYSLKGPNFQSFNSKMRVKNKMQVTTNEPMYLIIK